MFGLANNLICQIGERVTATAQIEETRIKVTEKTGVRGVTILTETDHRGIEAETENTEAADVITSEKMMKSKMVGGNMTDRHREERTVILGTENVMREVGVRREEMILEGDATISTNKGGAQRM